MKTTQKLPAALAIQRGFVITDGVFKNIKNGKLDAPVFVVEHGIRGTQNVNKENGAEKDIANIQRTESAKLDEDADGLSISFEMRAADLAHGLLMCAEPQDESKIGANFRAAWTEFVNRSKQSGALEKLAQRYARNILNARWIWRNRSYAQKVQIIVREGSGATSQVIANVDALKVSTQHFDNPTPDEVAIAKVLARGLSGEKTAALKIEAQIDFGVQGAVEVFPSQNYCAKSKGFARSLFKLPLRGIVAHDDMGSGQTIVGRAALRDQKIANAIRTIDSWHKGFAQNGVVVAVEPMGASLEFAQFFREKSENAFELLKNLAQTDPSSDEGQYLLAILIRGGVFGEESEKKKNKKKAEAAGASAESDDDSEE
jgi:CRISPR-associated protein Csy3